MKSLVGFNGNAHIINSFKVDKSLFYDLCMQANSVCAINYATISMQDLLAFCSIYVRDKYREISIKKSEKSKVNAKRLAK